MRLLLSINPQHIKKIISGEKKYEYRKSKCKLDVSGVVFYVTAPVKKIIGASDISDIIIDDIDTVWSMTHFYSGIERQFYYTYYQGKKIAVAYMLENLQIYPNSVELSALGKAYAPQSHCYLTDEHENRLAMAAYCL